VGSWPYRGGARVGLEGVVPSARGGWQAAEETFTWRGSRGETGELGAAKWAGRLPQYPF
jgi:hypothetical protein